MPAYNSFNLATQGRNNSPTTNYYASIATPAPRSSILGQTSGSDNTPATAGAGWTQGQSATPYLQQFLNGRNPYGTSGLNLENSLAGIPANSGRIDPRLYNYGYNQVDQSEGGSTRMFSGNPNVNERGQIVRNGQTYVQAGEALDRIIDPTKVEYDPEFGLITDPSNINMPEGNLERYMPYIVAAGLGGPVAAHALGGAAGTAAVPPNMSPIAPTTVGSMGAAPEVLGMPGAAGELAAGGGAAASGAGAAGSVAVPPNMAAIPATGGAGIPSLAAPPAVAGTGSNLFSNPLWRAGANIAGAIGNNYLANQQQNQYNAAADRADPFGQQNRQEAIRRIWELYNDPSSIENTPGYTFARDQGEQGVQRAAAGKGYFRSPNMLYDLSKFNQGLASQTYDKEMQRLMAMAGVQFDPSNAAAIQARGVGQGTSMRAAGIMQAIESGGDFWTWLNSLG